MVLAWLLLITGLAISTVAIYYSVLGLSAIFAAAVIPIYIMGGTLEVAKLVCASWLKANWHRVPWLMKIYMTSAVLVLMLITSMGIFGFLSKAHIDQVVPLGDNVAKVSFIDEKIKNERDTIENARILIKQLDNAVIGIQASPDREIRLRDGTVRIESSSERALQVRRSQARDRAALTKTIEEAQSRIVKLQEEKAPISSQLRSIEAEVGPIKYIAKFIYGDNPDQNLLEKAVTWVIILLVVVFDPLAVIMILAAQMSFLWARENKSNIETSTITETPQSSQNQDQDFKKEEPYLTQGFVHFKNLNPVVSDSIDNKKTTVESDNTDNRQTEETIVVSNTVNSKQTEENPIESNQEETEKKKSKKKTYMIKEGNQQVIKNKK
jgi:hypothetical protein